MGCTAGFIDIEPAMPWPLSEPAGWLAENAELDNQPLPHTASGAAIKSHYAHAYFWSSGAIR